MYRILRNILFLLPAETAHYVSMNLLQLFCSLTALRRKLENVFSCKNAQPVSLFGLQFPNAIGLGAGFDKNANYLEELRVLGFGFIEIGTVTPKPQAGNEKPRLFRLKKDRALVNRMGFNNDGVELVASRLRSWREVMEKGNAETSSSQPGMLIGGNIGKNKTTPNEEAWQDYEICFRALHPYVDFFIVNVSSPNTPGLRALQEKDALRKILTGLQSLNEQSKIQRPILLKIAPDLSVPEVDDVIDLAKEISLDGLVVSNTTISREGLQTETRKIKSIGAGGLSGKPLQQRSTELIRYISQKTGGTIPIIGSGGIFNGPDAMEKLQAGASLVEVWTGFIYEGPFIVKRICKALSKH